MGVLLQGFYKMRPNDAVPSPADGDAAVPWWWDHLAGQAAEFRRVGFTAVWLPPALKSSAGAKVGSDGYGPFDDYDIGSKNQMGSVSTRFGTREQLQRCVAVLRANGLDVYLDMVEHQRLGDPDNFVFRYKGADGSAAIGRFPKDPTHFVPQVPRDPHLGGPAADDFAFGRELAPINGRPPVHYVIGHLIAASDWLTRALDAQGYRLDDVKGLSTDFVRPLLESGSMAGKFAVGEFFDGNRVLVNGWVSNPHGMQGRASAFDFPLRFVLAAMCNNAGRFNMADLDQVGLVGIAPTKAVTFVENHDTDLSPGAVVFNKLLGYAYILTSEGYPCVYYRDYSTDRNCYGLKPQLDNLIWIHEKLAAGGTQQRWKDFNVFAYERDGGPRLLVALNNDPDNQRIIEVATGFGAHVPLHDYTGHAADVITDGGGGVRLTVPRNLNGLGYVCYSRPGFGGGFQPPVHSVTQVFEGATDLDILPALNARHVQVARIWSAAQSEIAAQLDVDRTGWGADTRITVEVIGPNDQLLASATATRDAAGSLRARSNAAGFHSLQLAAAGLPEAVVPYALSTQYTATQVLDSEAPAAALDAAAAAAASHGQWGAKLDLPNVGIHAHVLPSGKVLLWGRRDQPSDSLDVHSCTPFVWDPANGGVVSTPQPTLPGGATVNLFCSGHTFLADGRLLVIGGHLADGDGVNQVSLYDWRNNSWTPSALMNHGRWYPTAVTLANGDVLACAGTYVDENGNEQHNDVQQVWSSGVWRSLVNFIGLMPYPRMHVDPTVGVFMSGPLAMSYRLDTTAGGAWTPVAARGQVERDYAPSVLYDAGKVLYTGGGNNQGTQAPTNEAEIIDLTASAPAWRPTGAMHFPRRQHNATLLPDGTVLVTGGTRGGGGANNGFNDLTPGMPVHEAELWNPHTNEWTLLAAEAVDRCYHATAVLLPDATVLSAGGGEYRPDGVHPNNPGDSHRDAQVFSPPYLFNGARPQILQVPQSVAYGQTFEVTCAPAVPVGQVSWIRLPSVTHSFDQNQRINFLEFTARGTVLSVKAPATANLCPPGHYMLFVLSKAGVPSVAKIVQIRGAVPPAAARLSAIPVAADVPSGVAAQDAAILRSAKGTRVTVGVTSTCPYGIQACWGGAYEALQHLSGVQAVRPRPNARDSTAEVFLSHAGLPDLEHWPEQFTHTANGSYLFRGVEVSLTGTIQNQGAELWLAGTDERPPILLAPLGMNKLQWDHKAGRAQPETQNEVLAYQQLIERLTELRLSFTATVTGTLRWCEQGWVLAVRGW